MFGGHFYHEKTKKAVALFGRLFNNLYVIRKNSSGAVISQVKVPLSYAPKNKFLERIRENPDLQNVSIFVEETSKLISPAVPEPGDIPILIPSILILLTLGSSEE